MVLQTDTELNLIKSKYCRYCKAIFGHENLMNEDSVETTKSQWMKITLQKLKADEWRLGWKTKSWWMKIELGQLKASEWRLSYDINFGNFLKGPRLDQRKPQVDGVEMLKFGFRINSSSQPINQVGPYSDNGWNKFQSIKFGFRYGFELTLFFRNCESRWKPSASKAQ